jgi:hypothetical protein
MTTQLPDPKAVLEKINSIYKQNPVEVMAERTKMGSALAFVQGDVVAPVISYETFRGREEGNAGNLRFASVTAPNNSALSRGIDLRWLRSAADTYKISPDPRDYVVWEVPLVTADIPNRNGDMISTIELGYYNPIYGRTGSAGWIGKPTHHMHQNNDPAAAKGVIFDSQIFKRGPMRHVVMALAFDRTKDPQLVAETLREAHPGFSMGTLLVAASCSICGLRTNGIEHCRTHNGPNNEMKMKLFGTRLSYETLHLINPFEASKVGSPADIRARGRNNFSL